MRYEVTDVEWAAIRSLLQNEPRGIPAIAKTYLLLARICTMRAT
jgi:hypothetical protein